MKIDHVLIAARDLTRAARRIEERHGLSSIEGGRHPGWGTANRIVPLGETYLELIAVVDEAEAAQSTFGSWVAGVEAAPRPLAWAVRTSELDDVADRLGLTITTGSRNTRDDRVLRWRLAGVEQAAAEPSLPFFIEWDAATPFPGDTPVTHRAGRVRIAGLQLAGDTGRIAAWLGAHELPVTVRPGAPAVAAVLLTGDSGEIVLDAGSL
jgi:hypothetical protein